MSGGEPLSGFPISQFRILSSLMGTIGKTQVSLETSSETRFPLISVKQKKKTELRGTSSNPRFPETDKWQNRLGGLQKKGRNFSTADGWILTFSFNFQWIFQDLVIKIPTVCVCSLLHIVDMLWAANRTRPPHATLNEHGG